MNDYLPTVPGVVNAMRNGRNPYEGYQRGWGLQYGGLKDLILVDSLYRRASSFANQYSIVSEDNRMNLFLIMRFFLSSIDKGHIIEFGSYRGGNAMFLAFLAKQLYPGMKVYALDTYEGMPITDKYIDCHKKDDFSDVNYDSLVDIASQNKLDNLIFVKGLFSDTVDTTLEQAGAISLSHIDCDISSSVLFSYQKVSEYMVEGGYIVFDDATTSSCIGATEVVEQHLVRNQGLHSEQIWPHFVFRSSRGSMTCSPDQLHIAPMVNIPAIDNSLMGAIAAADTWASRVAAIEASTSWRITRPLRALGRAWRAFSEE